MNRNAFALRPRQAGVTLIELMVVVIIISILASIAYPSYTSSVTKTRRRAAEACLGSYASWMERYYTTNLSYTDSAGSAPTLAAIDCASAANTGNYYDYTFDTVASATYRVQAVAQGAQATHDASCSTLKLDQTGQRWVGANSDTTSVGACW